MCCLGREGAPESKIKSVKDSDPNMVYCLGQVFVDDVIYKQCPYKSEMEATDKSWYYDSSDNILHIHGATSNKTLKSRIKDDCWLRTNVVSKTLL